MGLNRLIMTAPGSYLQDACWLKDLGWQVDCAVFENNQHVLKKVETRLLGGVGSA